MTSFLEKLQAKPYETRVKILWSCVLVCGVLLVTLFVWNIKNTVSNIDGKSLIKPNAQNSNTAETAKPYASVEWVEQSNNSLKIYFNFNNAESDILNVSKLENISLKVEDKILTAQKLTDRQGNTYVQKILSHTQNFGVLTFPATDAKTGQLIFDQMFFEKSSSNIFKQTLNLNLENLSKPNLRH